MTRELRDADYLPSTMLSDLSDHDWQVVSHSWAQYGAAFYVVKMGRGWRCAIGRMHPGNFTTKKAADAFVDRIVLSEARLRRQAAEGATS